MTFYKRLSAFLYTTCIILAAGLVSNVSMATTPDGETPANEGVCDGLHGGTPGLYGLCVAYCEAQDLDTVDKEPPRTKILENYRKKMQTGDADMPCVQVPCPCWSAEELSAITGDGVAAYCTASSTAVRLTDVATKPRYGYADINRSRCAYVDINAVPPLVRNQNISADDAQACFSALSQACADLGL